MCDYSLHNVASRPAKVGDKLVVTDFARSITRGFAAVGETGVAVCLRPGTELAFEDEVLYDRALSLSGKARVNHKVARFRQINMDHPQRPDRLGHAARRRSDGDCSSITGGAYDSVGGTVPETRRLRWLSVRAGTQRDGRSP
jgi:hypothetical protein